MILGAYSRGRGLSCLSQERWLARALCTLNVVDFSGYGSSSKPKINTLSKEGRSHHNRVHHEQLRHAGVEMS